MGSSKDCDAVKEKGKFFQNDFLQILMQDILGWCYLVLNFSQSPTLIVHMLDD